MGLTLTHTVRLRTGGRDRLIFLLPHKAVVLRGQFVQMVATKILPLLNGRNGIDEIALMAHPSSPEVVRAIIKELEKIGVVKGIDSDAEVEPTVPRVQTSMCDLPSSLAARAEQLSDPVNGLIQAFERLPNHPSDPPIERVQAIGYTNLSTRPRRFTAIGKGLFEAEAAEPALGEAVERYAAGTYREDALIYASYAALGGSAIDPRELVNFTTSQYGNPRFPFVPFSTDRKYAWARATSPLAQRDIMIPAQLVFVPFTPERQEAPIWRSNTSGIASGPNPQFALLQALFELVERDALMLTWYTKHAFRRIELRHSLPPRLEDVVERIAKAELEVSCYALQAEFEVPVCLTAILDLRFHSPMISVGCAASANWENAIYKALLEAIHARAFARSRASRAQSLRGPTDVHQLEHHGLYYFDSHERLEAFEFLLRGDVVPLERLSSSLGIVTSDALNTLLDRIASKGYPVYFVDLAVDEVRVFGYQVCRAFIPGLIPLHFGHNTLPAGLARLGRGIGSLDATTNGWPHPFM